MRPDPSPRPGWTMPLRSYCEGIRALSYTPESGRRARSDGATPHCREWPSSGKSGRGCTREQRRNEVGRRAQRMRRLRLARRATRQRLASTRGTSATRHRGRARARLQGRAWARWEDIARQCPCEHRAGRAPESDQRDRRGSADRRTRERSSSPRAVGAVRASRRLGRSPRSRVVELTRPAPNPSVPTKCRAGVGSGVGWCIPVATRVPGAAGSDREHEREGRDAASQELRLKITCESLLDKACETPPAGRARFQCREGAERKRSLGPRGRLTCFPPLLVKAAVKPEPGAPNHDSRSQRSRLHRQRNTLICTYF